jgi:hypothetical protein
MALLDPFLQAIAAPPGGTGAVGWVGLDTPLEILDAAGLRPVRLTAVLATSTPAADLFGEGGGHPLLRGLVDGLIEGPYASLDTVVISGAPVTGILLNQFLISLERMGASGGMPETVMVDLAHDDTPAVRRFNLHSLAGLQARFGNPGPGALREAIKGRNHIRKKLRQVEVLRRGPAPRLFGAQALQVFQAGFGLSPGGYGALLDSLLSAAPSAAAVSGKPVIVSGSDIGGVALYEALEARGLRVVADDHDSGSRTIGPLVNEAEDPLAALAHRYAHRDAAPAQWTTASRVDYLLSLVRETGAEAVIFDIPPFEHPAAWDYPAQRQALDDAGIAHVLLPPTAYLDPKAAANIAAASLMTLAQEHR